MSGEAKWYVVHTYSGYENKVASTLEKTVENRNLQDVIQGVKIPTEIVIEKDSKGMQTLIEQLLLFQRGSKIHDDAPDALEGAIYLLQRKDASTSNLTQANPMKHRRMY